MERMEARLLDRVRRASEQHRLLEPGDRVLVGMSGGKDSYVMLHLLRRLQAILPFEVELVPVHLDQGHPGFPTDVLEGYLASTGLPYEIVRQPTYAIVKDKTAPGKAYCSMCARLRRGILYSAATRLGCTKLALGHHRDDAVETLLLNVLYAGQIKAMPPRLTSDDGEHTVIRPLILCAEADIAELASALAVPILPCTLCGQQPDLKRAKVKALLDGLSVETPAVRANAFAALGNVVPSHLMDPRLRDAEPTGVDALFDGLDATPCGEASA